MADGAIQEKVERLSEAFVMLEVSDLPALADMHTRITELAGWAGDQGFSKTQYALWQCAQQLEAIILEEVKDPVATLDTVGRMVGAVQRIVRDGCAEGDVEFPVEFLEPSSAQQDDSHAGAPKSAVSITLPAYVDETIFAEFLTRQQTELEEMEEKVLAIETGCSAEILGALKRQLHTLKGESALLGLNEVEKLCHAAEDGLQTSEPSAMADLLLSLKDWLKRAFDAYAGHGPMPEDSSTLYVQLQRGRSDAASAPAPVAAPVPDAAPVEVSEEAPAEEGMRFEAKPLEGDKDLIGEFILEANEHLENSDLQLLTLETDPGNQDCINAVFRAFHTLKGVSGFLALDEVQALAHEAENLLDKARKNELALEGPVMDVVFDAVDVLKHCISNVGNALSTGDDLQPVDGLPALARRIRAAAAGECPIAPARAPIAVAPDAPLGQILVEMGAATADAVRDALDAQRQPITPKKVGEILVAENVISSRKLEQALEYQHDTAPEKKVGEILVDLGYTTEEEIGNALKKQEHPAPPKLGEALVSSGEANPREVAEALRAQRAAAQNQGGAIQVHEAVKVDADRLDLLVDMIGELVIAESMVAQAEELKTNLSTDLGRHLNQLDKITRELQVMAMSLRMVPVRATFQKMARLVRDLAKKMGKPVNFVMTGEDTELDKTVVDKIGDPLVHMVRNAIDHGLEDSVEQRVAAGKAATGTVTLRAFHAGGNIHIQIEDDGRGLNRDAILRKATERGLIGETEIVSDREAWNLIFEPGFSTAAQVTEVSGRGVGMDVVKRNIEALRGMVDIHSEEGKGSVFTIRLPLTLAIIDGMVVRVGRERYILPTLSIVISLRPEAKDLNTVVNRGEMLSLHGELLPLFRLHRMFGIDDAVTEATDGTVVVVEGDGGKIGLLVDEILGQQQTVIKPLGEALKGLPGIAGGAIMPDGRVGLILDVGGLLDIARKSSRT
jgi:two-component system chemotaxis sensor kinase CheA